MNGTATHRSEKSELSKHVITCLLLSDKTKSTHDLCQERKERRKAAWLGGNPTLQIREIRKNKIGFKKAPTTFAKSVKKGGKLLIGCLAWRESPHFTPTARSLVCLRCDFSFSLWPDHHHHQSAPKQTFSEASRKGTPTLHTHRPVSCLPSASAAILTFCAVIFPSRCDHHQE